MCLLLENTNMGEGVLLKGKECHLSLGFRESFPPEPFWQVADVELSPGRAEWGQRRHECS